MISDERQIRRAGRRNDPADVVEALRQLAGGEPVETILRRLRDWRHDATLEAGADSVSARRIENQHY